MLYKSRAIVLHAIHYGDTSLIVHLYTEKFGRQVFFIKGAKSKKSAFRSGLFFPLNILELEAYYRESSSMQKLKEAINQPIYTTIHTNPIKSAIAIFLAEILFRVLHSEHENARLFEFLYQSFIQFDHLSDHISDFHLLFLIQLLHFEGFFPTNNFSDSNNCFSIQLGRFVSQSEATEIDMTGNLAKLFSMLLQFKNYEVSELKMNNITRRELLNKIIDYYHFHLPLMGQLRSLSVLNEVFK